MQTRMTASAVARLTEPAVQIQPRPDALAVLQQLPAWIDDYNETTRIKACECSHRESSFKADRNQPPCPV